jgi:integrase
MNPKTSGSRWCIDGLRVNGKRKRIFFKTRTAAEQELTRIKTLQRRDGDALGISDSLRIMARDAAKELEPFGKTIRDATEFYLKYLREAQKSVSVEELVNEFLATQKRSKHSKLHVRDLERRLGRFCEAFGKSPVRTITTQDLEKWIHHLRLAPQSLNNFRGRIASLFAYGMKHGYLERNPVSVIDPVKVVDAPPEIFSPDQLRLVFEHSPRAALPCLVIGAFAGLRSAEVMRLEWKDIDLRRGHINVAASKSKTARRRLITMSDNLRAWLAPYAGSTGRLWPKSQTSYYNAAESARIAAGLAKWPQNGLRHSFASYHLAKHQNAAMTALDMGHVVGAHMVFNHYREIVTPEEAERYWNIFPPTEAKNVVPMAAA